MLVAAQLSSLLFHVGVALVAIAPRLPNDRPFPLTLGGDLSHPFRRVLLGLVTSNAIRVIFFEDPRIVQDAFSDSSHHAAFRLYVIIILRAVENFLMSFLCLLTPYLMHCQLQNKVNISRHPGRDLMMWVYLVVVLSIISCILVGLTDDASYGWIKKLGDALTFVPVYKTLRLYSAIITPGGRYPRRGDMSVQTLLTVEYLALIATLLSAVGYVQMKGDNASSRPIYEAFRHLGAYAQLTRLLTHASLMNCKDEAEYFSKYAMNATTTTTDTAGTDNDNDSQADRHGPLHETPPSSLARTKPSTTALVLRSV